MINVPVAYAVRSECESASKISHNYAKVLIEEMDDIYSGSTMGHEVNSRM